MFYINLRVQEQLLSLAQLAKLKKVHWKEGKIIGDKYELGSNEETLPPFQQENI